MHSLVVLMMFISISVFAANAIAEEKKLALGDYEFSYTERGFGDPVLLVHGGLQDYRFWDTVLGIIAEKHRAISYSRRNHFPNQVDADGAPDNAADLHGDDLAGIVKVLKLEQVHVVAHSSGAVAALFFALKYPDLVRSLVINEPPAAGFLSNTPDGGSILKEQATRLSSAREAFLARDFDRAIPLFVDGVGGPGTFKVRSEASKRMALTMRSPTSLIIVLIALELLSGARKRSRFRRPSS